jgi:hypothetical protein
MFATDLTLALVSHVPASLEHVWNAIMICSRDSGELGDVPQRQIQLVTKARRILQAIAPFISITVHNVEAICNLIDRCDLTLYQSMVVFLQCAT